MAATECGPMEGKKKMIARLRTQRLASPSYRAQRRGWSWARERASYPELCCLQDHVRSFEEDERDRAFESPDGFHGQAAARFVFVMHPRTYGDSAAVLAFWRSVGYRELPGDAEVQLFAAWALQDWESVKGEV